ncbi:hypothetical protein A5893_11720 [Pedobacter psychrophilus]|uniref:histidine kinase n=1 Tax=Pedobacter psychrophilus TaxID=1826909 RepID=A0A179DET0_9SPHI|nr:ATP-binding protein [Pedobacter psychrophilus]OAQ39322.1 hypothetical protein A5893_11720 [Pedobacter psychrophilus]
MPKSTSFESEQKRLAALKSYNILDTANEKDFDELTVLASTICQVPIALISLVDEKRQYFKSHTGLSASETPIEQSFCAHAISSTKDMMIVDDATEDNRFKNNPLVIGHPNITFYAGVPLINEDGFALGTLCVIDTKKKQLTNQQQEALKIIAKQVMGKLELRRKISELEEFKQEQQILFNKLLTSEERTNFLFADAPVAIGVLSGKQLIIEKANDNLLNVWGRDKSCIGKSLDDTLPELKNQPLYKIIQDVFISGKPYYGENLEVVHIKNNKEVKGFFNFVYHPIKNKENIAIGIMMIANDVTEQTLNKKETAKLNLKLQIANKELESSNEEQSTINEELLSTNDSLIEAQGQLEETINDVELSRARFRDMILSSPVAMLVFTGDNFIFDEVNDAMLLIIDKDFSIKGKPLIEVMPELIGQPILDILYNTYHTGQEVRLLDAPVSLNRNGELTLLYFNVTYSAILENGKITGVMQSAVDVTVQVLARNELKKAEELMRMTINAANLGTWVTNMTTKEVIANDRLKELYGFNKDEEFSYEDSINYITEDFRPTVIEHIENAVNRKDSYNIEFKIKGKNDQQIRWIKSYGKLNLGSDDNTNLFSGVAMDITEQKGNEQRKNAFIGMVSHELKNPLTSINAYLQLLEVKANKAKDDFTSGVLGKTLVQVSKMRNIIGGFLDVSRYESGRISIDIQSFDLSELIKEVEEESITTITSHKVIFAPVEYTLVNADRDKIGQVINNFINNAVKYSPINSTINISCVSKNNLAEVCVKDEGMGISSENQKNLFERYFRVQGEHMKLIAGFGIGLYICKEIIERHNGKIGVESEMGKGSVFYFQLPL